MMCVHIVSVFALVLVFIFMFIEMARVSIIWPLCVDHRPQDVYILVCKYLTIANSNPSAISMNEIDKVVELYYELGSGIMVYFIEIRHEHAYHGCAQTCGLQSELEAW